jgi:hypothetical protein
MKDEPPRTVEPITVARFVGFALVLVIASAIAACGALELPLRASAERDPSASAPVSAAASSATLKPSAAVSPAGNTPYTTATTAPTQTPVPSPAPTPLDCEPAGTASPGPSPLDVNTWTFRGHRILDAEPRYGGVYVDGNIFVINVTAEPELVCDEIRSILPAGALVQMRIVDYPWSELEAVMATVESDWLELTNAGVAINFLDADEVANRVVIGIQPFSDQVASDLRAKYGRTIKVIERGPAYYS